MPDWRALEDLGWNEALAQHVPSGLAPARVTSVYAARVDVANDQGSMLVSLRSGARRESDLEGGIAVGDWVAIGDKPVVEAVLPRRSVLLRKAAGLKPEPQAIAANVDRVFVVTSADADFNVRRIERYLVAIEAGGAEPRILLTKADLASDLEAFTAAPLAATTVTSAKTGLGLDELRSLVEVRGSTTAFVGSSGVGKSALINALLGSDVQREGAVRAYDGRGRHTTTKRTLFALPGGGLVVDTPGMREFQPWGADTAVDDTFDDVLAVAEGCRFRDCIHEREPACAVREAVANGTLAIERVRAWQKLRA